jgi:hypothetical protein
MEVTVLSELKNKRGELKTKIVRVENKIPKNGIEFDTINELYKELLLKYKTSNITIIAKPLYGGFVTLKSEGYVGKSLKHTDENYFSTVPKEAKKRICGTYYYVDITISL